MSTIRDTRRETQVTDGDCEPAGSRARAGTLRAAERVVADLFGEPATRAFSVRYWDGSTEAPDCEAKFTLVLRSPSALRRMMLPPSELAIVEAYLYGDIDVEGSMEAAADLGDLVGGRIASIAGIARVLRHVLLLPRQHADPVAPQVRVARGLRRLGSVHSRRRDARAVRFHYDVGNDFYALWLDSHMVYSCGYFVRSDDGLEHAQEAKLEHVCRKLRLEQGDRFLDIGCGWGALVIHAARRYGVRATGITLSEAQATFARERVIREGLSARVRIEVRDYRDLGEIDAFDKIASVGMVEHVGLNRLSDYFHRAYRALKPGGLFLNHGIVGIADSRPRSWLDPVWHTVWRRDQFIRRYVFPDGDLVPAATIIANAEEQGFELRDVESLREHYVMTLRQWVERLERQHAQAAALIGEPTYRVWRLYMSASAHAFRVGRIGVLQSLLAKPTPDGSARLPRTREDLYRK